MWSGSPRLESSQFFIKWMCFRQYWEFCSTCTHGCCSQTLFTSVQFIQLFIVLLWSPSFSFSLSLSPSLTLSFPCFLCVSVFVHSVFLLSQRHIFRPLLLSWRTPWRSQWWDWPFHIKWVVNRICYTWPGSTGMTEQIQESTNWTMQNICCTWERLVNPEWDRYVIWSSNQ